MTSPEGGFYTAQDADSEGEEGKFYLWSPEEITQILGKREGQFFCDFYNVTSEGNFEGRSILNLIHHRGGIFTGEADPALNKRIDAARKKLFAARELRIHPHRDDKILTSWNGLMISALARGAWVLNEERYALAADRAARFILASLCDDKGRLLARYREGKASFPAYLDDYAFLTWGLIELYQASFNVDYLAEALKLTRQMKELFWDGEKGGFFFTGSDGEKLLARPKEIYDGATPSGNSVTALNLLRLARLTAGSQLEELASNQMRAFGGTVAGYPVGYTFYLCALDFALGPPVEIILAGDKEAGETKEMLNKLRQTYLPSATILLSPGGREGEKMAALVPNISGRYPVDNKTAVYICRDYICQAPVTEPEKLVGQLT